MTGYTPYQKGIIKRYYEHRDTLALQNLAEIVSDLYLAESEREKEKLWKRAASALGKLGLKTVRCEMVVDKRDVAGLARLLTDLQR